MTIEIIKALDKERGFHETWDILVNYEDQLLKSGVVLQKSAKRDALGISAPSPFTTMGKYLLVLEPCGFNCFVSEQQYWVNDVRHIIKGYRFRYIGLDILMSTGMGGFTFYAKGATGVGHEIKSGKPVDVRNIIEETYTKFKVIAG